jgi:hypothetical protein
VSTMLVESIAVDVDKDSERMSAGRPWPPLAACGSPCFGHVGTISHVALHPLSSHKPSFRVLPFQQSHLSHWKKNPRVSRDEERTECPRGSGQTGIYEIHGRNSYPGLLTANKGHGPYPAIHRRFRLCLPGHVNVQIASASQPCLPSILCLPPCLHPHPVTPFSGLSTSPSTPPVPAMAAAQQPLTHGRPSNRCAEPWLPRRISCLRSTRSRSVAVSSLASPPLHCALQGRRIQLEVWRWRHPRGWHGL